MQQIFIPSKGRSTNCSFIKLLQANKISATIVLEHQDFEAYNRLYPEFGYLQLPESNRGITYVRNFIKEHTENMGLKYFWMADDDITNLYFRQNAKMIKGDPKVLLEYAFSQLSSIKNLGIGSLDYKQLAWSATKDFNKNSFCDVLVLINNEATKGLRYRQYVEGKEDRDFAMQVIKSGKDTARTTLYAFGAPKNGSNAGGLKEIFYDAGKEKICQSRMVELWGEQICVAYLKEDGRPDVKIYWKNINSNQVSLF